MTRKIASYTAAALAVCATMAAGASAAPIPLTGNLDLAAPPAGSSVKWTADGADLAGASVAGIGDFDGDGRPDMAVGEPKRDTAAGADSGAATIVFAPGSGGRLGDPATTLLIRGAGAKQRAGFAVHGAGDVNGDGLGDLVLGAPYAGGDKPDAARGEAYVVFGRAGRAEIDLAAPDFGGFRITGGSPGDHLGRSVGSMGDINSDGLADVIVGAPRRDVAPDKPDAGSAYVVFGRKGGEPVDVQRLVDDKQGWRVDGGAGSTIGGAYAGRAVSSIADLNFDGRRELLVTAPRGGTGLGRGVRPKGFAYVVFGRTEGVVDLDQLGAGGYAITGKVTDPGQGAERSKNGDFLGESIEPVGDVNGDGFEDLVVGAHLADAADRLNNGIAYVVFGKPDAAPVDTEKLGFRGFRIFGIDEQDQTGFDTSAAGDFNGDGLADVAISSLFAEPLSRKNAGAAYVIWGRRGAPEDVDLAEFEHRAMRIGGAAEQDTLGFSLDTLGDVNGDTAPDLVLGVPAATSTDATTARGKKPGGAYVVFGATSAAADHPLAGVVEEPGYAEAAAKGCAGAINVQVMMEDNGYTDRQADPQRVRRTGLEAYLSAPRNQGTVLGVTGFDEDGEPEAIIEPTVLAPRRSDAMVSALRKEIDGEDDFPGYPYMIRTFANDNPGATARIVLADGYLFRDMEEYDGLTEGNPPTYVIAVGSPEERDESDIRELRRLARDTGGRFYLARGARGIEKAFLAIESRLRCDLAASDHVEDLEPGEKQEIAETELSDDAHTADIRLTWRDEEAGFDVAQVELVRDGRVVRRFDRNAILRAYGARSPVRTLTGRRGSTFRSLHLRGVNGGGRLRVIARAARGKRAGTVYARVTQSRRR